MNYGSSGNGSLTHLNMELLKQMAGISLVHIPYRGSTFARNALLAGEVGLIIDGMLPALPFIKAGRLKALGMVDSTRSPVAPEIPTIAEAGVKGYASDTWYGLLAPAGTPKDVIDILYKASVDAIKSPDVRSAMAKQGVELTAGSPAQFKTLLDREKIRWDQTVKFSGAKSE